MLQQQQPAFIISWEFISWKHGRGAKCGFRVSSLFSTAQKKVNVIFGGICCDVSLAGVTVVKLGLRLPLETCVDSSSFMSRSTQKVELQKH